MNVSYRRDSSPEAFMTGSWVCTIRDGAVKVTAHGLTRESANARAKQKLEEKKSNGSC